MIVKIGRSDDDDNSKLMWPVGRLTYSWEQAQCCFVGRPGRCACAGGWGVEGSAFLTIIITTIIFTITTIIFITISTDPMRGGGVCVHHHHHRHHHHNDYIHHRHDYLHHHRHCFIAKVLLLLLSSSLLLPAMARGRVIMLKNVLVGVRMVLRWWRSLVHIDHGHHFNLLTKMSWSENKALVLQVVSLVSNKLLPIYWKARIYEYETKYLASTLFFPLRCGISACLPFNSSCDGKEPLGDYH